MDYGQPDNNECQQRDRPAARHCKELAIESAKPVIANAASIEPPKNTRDCTAMNLMTTDNDIEMMMATRTVDTRRDVTQRRHGALLKLSIDPDHENLPL